MAYLSLLQENAEQYDWKLINRNPNKCAVKWTILRTIETIQKRVKKSTGGRRICEMFLSIHYIQGTVISTYKHLLLSWLLPSGLSDESFTSQRVQKNLYFWCTETSVDSFEVRPAILFIFSSVVGRNDRTTPMRVSIRITDYCFFTWHVFSVCGIAVSLIVIII